jgi:hypothetical protein
MQTIWMTCEKKIKSNTIVYVYIAKDFRPNDSTVYDDLANVWAERRDTTGDILPCDWPVVAQLTKRGNVSLCYSLNGADGNSLFSDVESTQISRHCCRRRRKKKNRSCPRNSLGASRRQYNEIFKHGKPKKGKKKKC